MAMFMLQVGDVTVVVVVVFVVVDFVVVDFFLFMSRLAWTLPHPP